MMLAAFSDDRFYSVDGSIFPEGSFWHTEAGVARYGEGDPETAAKLLKDAGYDGTPIRLLTSRQYEFHYKIGEVAKAYLEAAGFKVDMQVVDWATLTTRRADPKQWDIFITHSNFLAIRRRLTPSRIPIRAGMCRTRKPRPSLPIWMRRAMKQSRRRGKASDCYL